MSDREPEGCRETPEQLSLEEVKVIEWFNEGKVSLKFFQELISSEGIKGNGELDERKGSTGSEVSKIIGEANLAVPETSDKICSIDDILTKMREAIKLGEMDKEYVFRLCEQLGDLDISSIVRGSKDKINLLCKLSRELQDILESLKKIISKKDKIFVKLYEISSQLSDLFFDMYGGWKMEVVAGDENIR